MSVLGLRPLRIGEVLDAAIKLYLRNARTLMGTAATVVVPLQLLSAVVLVSVYSSGRDIPSGFGTGGAPLTAGEARARLGATAIQFVVTIIAVSFTAAACVKAVSDSYLDQPTGIGISLKFALRRLPALAVMQAVYLLGLMIGFVLLILPGAWLYGSWSIAIPVLLIERAGPFRSLRRAIRLVRRRWWPTAGALLVAVIMTGILGSLLTAVLTLLTLHGHPSVLLVVLITVLAQVVSGIVVQPFTATVTTVLYYDLRVRKEGYDVELLAAQLGLPASRLASAEGSQFVGVPGPEMVGQPGGPPYWPPPADWRPEQSRG